MFVIEYTHYFTIKYLLIILQYFNSNYLFVINKHLISLSSSEQHNSQKSNWKDW